MHAHEVLTLCGVLAAGFACQWLAWRLKQPAILLLLLTGIAAGPVTGLLRPDELLGDLMIPLVSISVAVILFEGSLTLRISELRGHGAVVRNLVTIGVLVTWVSGALAAYLLLDFDPYLAALFGAIVTVSGPTVVMPLLRALRPEVSVANVLRWESILIDPLGAILGLLVFEFIVAAQAAAGLTQASITMAEMAGAGLILGVLGGYLFGLALRRRVIPDYLRDYAALAAALTVFAAAEAFRGESGLLAVTVMGVWLANMRDVDIEDILGFKESLTLLLVAGLFIILAARLDLAALQSLGWSALVLLLVLQFVAGPARALVSSVGSELGIRARLFLGWVFPRGIVAAAISSLFALRLESSGYEGADQLVPLVFAVIIGTVVIQSLTAGPMSRLLGVAEPAPTGVLIVGANTAALAAAKALADAGLKVLVADSHWASIRSARMMGIPTYFGSVVSRYAEDNLPLTGIGNLLAMSRRPGFNELACLRYAGDFGRDHVYTLGTSEDREHAKHRISGERRGRVLFGGEHTLTTLIELFERGGETRATLLTEEFGYADHRQEHALAITLCAIDPDQRLHFPVSDETFEPAAGWTVIAIVPPD